jgi:signal transduction histidine kinase/ligand-binding sensor domain-containing protein/CheY-like chemotaxis protein
MNWEKGPAVQKRAKAFKAEGTRLRFTRILFLLALFLAGTTDGFSFDAPKTLGEYVFDNWHDSDGLPQNSINAILQTSEGYIWLATYEGLVRFDGVHFTIFDTVTAPGFTHNNITVLREGPSGVLWIGTQGGGLMRFANDKFTSYGAELGPLANTIWSIETDRDGNVWIGTDGGGLIRINQNNHEVFTSKDGLPSDVVRSLYADRDGSLWVGTDRGVIERKDNKFISSGDLVALRDKSVRSIWRDRSDHLWMGTYGSGLVEISGGVPRWYTTQNGLSDNHITTILEGHDGAIWIATDGGNLHRLKAGKLSSYKLPDNSTTALAEDTEGSIWIGMSTKGLGRLRKVLFHTVGESQGVSAASTVYEDARGRLWIGTFGGGVARYDHNQTRVYTTRNGLGNNIVRSIWGDRMGQIWFGTTGGGVSIFRRGRLHGLTTKNGLPTDDIRVVYSDRAGDIWIGTVGGGLCRLHHGRLHIYTTADGLGSDSVRSLYEDHAGNLWVGTWGGGLSKFRDGKFITYTTKDGLAHDMVTSIYEDQEGNLWITTNGGGLNLFANGSFTTYSQKVGLFENIVHQVVEDHRGNLWMTSNKGIFRVAKQELLAFAQHRVASITSTAYDTEDGLESREFNGGAPGMWVSKDGKIWFANIKGAVAADPAALGGGPSPRVLINKVLINKQLLSVSEDIRVPQGHGDVELDYTAPLFLAARKLRFRYRLEGFDQEWTDAGARRVAYYTNIPPGQYRFRVLVANNEGVWNDAGAALSFYLKPHLYQTLWFRAACVLGALILIIGSYGLRMRRVRKREEQLVVLVGERTQDLQKEIAEHQATEAELQAEILQRKQTEDELKLEVLERKRATEKAEAATRSKSEFLANMSHEIRTPLNGVMGMLELANETELTSEQKELLGMAHDSADALLVVLSDILDFSKIEAGKLQFDHAEFDLEQTVAEAARVLAVRAQQKRLRLVYSLSPDVPAAVVGDAARLKQVLMNLLGNAVKFTEHGEIVLRVELEQQDEDLVHLRFSVADTGIGIPIEKQHSIFEAFAQADTSVTRRFGGTGLGLTISTRIVSLMAGRIWVESEPGQGATFYFTASFGPVHKLMLEPTSESDSSPVMAPYHDEAGESLKILVAEDNIVNQRLALRLLEKSGHSVVVVNNGNEALARLKQQSFDLVLMDVEMREMDGYQATAAIRRLELDRGGHLPIVAMTANAMTGDRERCQGAGMDGYISKPINRRALEEEIQRVLHQSMTQYQPERA